MIDGTIVLVPCGRMTKVAIDQSLFLYDEDAHRFFKLNSSAAAIYERFDGESTVDDITSELAERYLDQAETVRASVNETIVGLTELGLVAESL